MKKYNKIAKDPMIMRSGVYVVLNFGAFRDLFYYLKDAKMLVAQEGTDKETGKVYYQIYKCDINLKNVRLVS